MRYTHCGISFMGQNSGWETFGLGTAELADSVRVTWPTGHVDRLYALPAILSPFRIVEGQSTDGVIQVDPDITLATSTRDGTVSTMGTLAVFPNPAGDRLWLDKPISGQCSIYSMEGKILFSLQLTNQSSLDIGDLPPGLYVVQLREAGHSQTAKFVKR
jgi:hypothetical protein